MNIQELKASMDREHHKKLSRRDPFQETQK